MKKRAVCIISGGMDSATAAFEARAAGYEIVALHFDYGQRTEAKERACFERICDALGARARYTLDAHFIAQIGGNALTDAGLKLREDADGLGVCAGNLGENAQICGEKNDENFASNGQICDEKSVANFSSNDKICNDKSAANFANNAQICAGENAENSENFANFKNPAASAAQIPNSYVPFRNGIFLAIAVALAEREGCEALYIGVVQEDSSGYPDCSEDFIAKFEQSALAGTAPATRVRICAPLVHLSKAQIVVRAAELGVPLEHTWSCYQDSAQACGVCDSCRLRLKGFALAGKVDPIPYKKREI